jgi:hypothetical protein
MTMDRGIRGDRAQPAPSARAEGVFLSLGLPRGIAEAFAGGHPIITMAVADLSREVLASLAIAIIACPLMAEDTDAMLVIQALKAAGYRGTLTVIAPRLPNVGMVEAELRGLCPDIGVKIISP